jgi:hypothetical protein
LDLANKKNMDWEEVSVYDSTSAHRRPVSVHTNRIQLSKQKEKLKKEKFFLKKKKKSSAQ